MAVTTKITVFWGVTPCSVIYVYQSATLHGVTSKKIMFTSSRNLFTYKLLTWYLDKCLTHDVYVLLISRNDKIAHMHCGALLYFKSPAHIVHKYIDTANYCYNT
jgi:hypothetical protein